MKTPEEALIDVLSASPAAEGTKAVRTFFLAVLAERAADLLDLDRGTVGPEWERLDDHRYRSRLFAWGETGWRACVGRLQPQMKSINDQVRAAGHQKYRDWSAMETSLFNVMPVVTTRVRRFIEAESPFPVLWPLLANDLSRRTYSRNAIDWVDPEWRYQNTLLLLGFFATCQLPAASHVRHVFQEAQGKPLGLRGLFFRIPEFVGDTALADTPIRITARTGRVSVH